MTTKSKSLPELILEKLEGSVEEIGLSPCPNLCVKHTKFLHCLWAFEKISQARMENEIDWPNIISRLKAVFERITTKDLNQDYRARLLKVIQTLEFHFERAGYRFCDVDDCFSFLFANLQDLIQHLDVEKESADPKFEPTELECCMWVFERLPEADLSTKVRKELSEKMDALTERLRELALVEKVLDVILLRVMG